MSTETESKKVWPTANRNTMQRNQQNYNSSLPKSSVPVKQSVKDQEMLTNTFSPQLHSQVLEL